ncbi:MAG: putative zinc-finger [Acidobacteria bacterium]|nr:putative zinc-finger [Acidobacteriota bacterium]
MRRIGESQMRCGVARNWLFRLLDRELSREEEVELEDHLASCPSCMREWRILTLPQRIARSIPVLEPPPCFYSRLRARLEMQKQSITIWQIIIGLSRQIVPALATVTLLIISLFAYLEFRGPSPDLYQAYDSIFMSGDRASRMVIADDVTEESVLHALAEKPLLPDGNTAKK